MKRRAFALSTGFTLLELVVAIFLCVFILAFLVLVVAPGGGANEHANRVKCASNLRCIGQALMLYANDNKGNYPRVRYAPGKPLTCFTKPAATEPFAEDGPDENDVTAAMFLLVRNCDLNPEVFVCPSSNQDKDTLGGVMANQRSNFFPANGSTLSYSFANMYPSKEMWEAEYRFNSGVQADFVIAADRNECRNSAASTDWNTASTSQIKDMNSFNHDSEGQNVMFNDGHVEWCTTPFVGDKHDHIYTQRNPDLGLSTGSAGNGDPKGQYDTVLLPYWEAGQPKPHP